VVAAAADGAELGGSVSVTKVWSRLAIGVQPPILAAEPLTVTVSNSVHLCVKPVIGSVSDFSISGPKVTVTVGASKRARRLFMATTLRSIFSRAPVQMPSTACSTGVNSTVDSGILFSLTIPV
jgi:hypothetical protein